MMDIVNERAFFEKVMGVPEDQRKCAAPVKRVECVATSESPGEMLMEGVDLRQRLDEATRKELQEAVDGLQRALDEGVAGSVWSGIKRVATVFAHPVRAWQDFWREYRVSKKEDPFLSLVSASFADTEVVSGLVGRTLDNAADYLDDQISKVRKGDVSVLSTQAVLAGVEKVKGEIARLEGNIKDVRQGFAANEEHTRELKDWYARTVTSIGAKRQALLAVLKEVLGGAEVGEEVKYKSAPESIKDSLDYALTMRQTVVNMITYKLPCGCDNMTSSPELAGSGITVEDEASQTTNRLWVQIMDGVGGRIPLEYGGDLIPKHIRAHRVNASIKDLGEMGRLKVIFEGDYTIIFHKAQGRPETMTARLRIVDDVLVEKIGATRHNPLLESVKFPFIRKELSGSVQGGGA